MVTHWEVPRIEKDEATETLEYYGGRPGDWKGTGREGEEVLVTNLSYVKHVL